MMVPVVHLTRPFPDLAIGDPGGRALLRVG